MFRNSRQTGRWIAIAVAVGLSCSSQALAVKPVKPPDDDSISAGYSIIPFAPDRVQFDSSGIFGLNDAGDVVGVVETGDGQDSYHVDLDTGTYTLLPGRVWSINNSGEIVGTVSGDPATDGYYLSAPDAEPILLSPLPGDSWVDIYSINNSRMIVGTSAGNPNGSTAVIWRPILNEDGTWSVDGPVPLLPLDGDTSSNTIDINDPIADGPFEILGSSEAQAVIWTVDLNADGTLSVPSDPVSLGTFDGTPVSGHAINSLGDICGSSGSPSLPIYSPFDGSAQSLNVVRNTSWGRAMDINDLGQCVGQIETVSRPNSYYLSAYRWEGPDADPIDLKKLIDEDNGWSLSYANYINNNGAIAGNGYYDGVQTWTGFIMVPAP